MIEYRTKTTTNKFKIGNNSYEITIDLKYSDDGPKIDIRVNSDTSSFNMRVVNLDVAEVHTVLDEVVNTLATLTHVHFNARPIPIAIPCAPAMTPGAPAMAPGYNASFYNR